jgi:hypothetical protein
VTTAKVVTTTGYDYPKPDVTTKFQCSASTANDPRCATTTKPKPVVTTTKPKPVITTTRKIDATTTGYDYPQPSVTFATPTRPQVTTPKPTYLPPVVTTKFQCSASTSNDPRCTTTTKPKPIITTTKPAVTTK